MKDDQPIPGQDEDEGYLESAMYSVPDVSSDAVERLLQGALSTGRSRLSYRRRRAVVGSGLAVAVVAAGAVGGVRVATNTEAGQPGHANQEPTSQPGSSQPPTVHPRETRQPQSLLTLPGAHLDWAVFSGGRASVAGWAIPTEGPRLSAWTRTDDGWGTADVVHMLNGPEGSQPTAGNAILFYRTYRARLLGPDGSTSPINVSRAATPASSGQALFGDPFGEWTLFAFDSASRTARPVPLPPGVQAYAAAWDNGGSLWVEGWGDGNQRRVYVAWSADGGATWDRHLVSGGYSYPGGLAVGSDGKVAAFAWRSEGDRTVRSSIISYNGGISWEALDRGVGPRWVQYVGYAGGSAAVTRLGNRLFVVDAFTGQLWTATGNWQHFRRAHTPIPVASIQTNGRLLWAIAGGGSGTRGSRLLISSDQGATWRIVTPR